MSVGSERLEEMKMDLAFSEETQGNKQLNEPEPEFTWKGYEHVPFDFIDLKQHSRTELNDAKWRFNPLSSVGGTWFEKAKPLAGRLDVAEQEQLLNTMQNQAQVDRAYRLISIATKGYESGVWRIREAGGVHQCFVRGEGPV